MPETGKYHIEQKFVELASGEIGKNKSLVISRRSDGKYSIAQKALSELDEGAIGIFLKNAIVVDAEGLLAVKAILDAALANKQRI